MMIIHRIIKAVAVTVIVAAAIVDTYLILQNQLFFAAFVLGMISYAIVSIHKHLSDPNHDHG